MFKLSISALLVVAILVVMLPGSAMAAQSLDFVESMVNELESAEYYTPEQLKLYLQYKEQRVEIITHIVQKGENLSAIARLYDVCPATISESNSIANPHLIHPGQELSFPAVPGLLYTVQEEDNLDSIADKFDVEYERIWFANTLISDELEPGTRLVIPGAKLPELPPMPVLSRSGSTNLYGVSLPRFIWPVRGNISSPFGRRGSGFHSGIDITGPRGTPIRAAAAGTVTVSGNRGSYGNMVIVQHNNDVATLYAHASRLAVRAGDSVAQGQVIAYVGATGNATGPHLHFEIRVKGTQVNPRQLLP